MRVVLLNSFLAFAFAAHAGTVTNMNPLEFSIGYPELTGKTFSLKKDINIGKGTKAISIKNGKCTLFLNNRNCGIYYVNEPCEKSDSFKAGTTFEILDGLNDVNFEVFKETFGNIDGQSTIGLKESPRNNKPYGRDLEIICHSKHLTPASAVLLHKNPGSILEDFSNIIEKIK